MSGSKAGEDKLRTKSEIAKREEEILKFWREREIFKKTLAKPLSPKGEFVFYEGPPTANGRPGIHHLESRAFKDTIPRYRTMRGYHVRRKAGWDTHGLPVELEVEKKLGFKSKKDIEAYGIAKFNAKCKESVLQYIDEWKRFTDRIAFWVDHDDTYFTFDNSYIESVWSILKHTHERGLLYKDYKVVPWCPRCGTALSSHEVALGYEEAEDPSVYVKFKMQDAVRNGYPEGTSFLVWTTTPWTLPGNVALAVREDLAYALVNGAIVAKEGGSLQGKDLVGLTYEPLYPFLKDQTGKAFKVYAADFVSTEDGTGIVHMAPMYGAEDFELGTKVGLLKQHVVGEDGKFLPEAKGFAGLFVKDADEKIIEDLEKRGLLFKKETIEHTYPFCWRCKTPLLYYARDSWYIQMSKLRDELIRENKDIHWEPEHIKDGRFGEWLREVKDWAISRARFWGTPLPIWECEQCKKFEVMGSIAELKEKGVPVPEDLHRPYVDEISFGCSCGGAMRRVSEVLDVWFDSGAMPFAQEHYPFERKEILYPADYISEAIDQTRGWFYTLHAVGVLMERGKAFKNVVCLGHVLDAKGKKMSKSLGNIIEPNAMIDTYGTDALRYFMYTVNAPGDSKNFDERMVNEIVKKNFSRLGNVLAFYELYAEKSLSSVSGRGRNASESDFSASHVLDRWILARLNELVEESTDGYENYQLDKATRPVAVFIDDLSTWYLRRSRERFKGETPDKRAALATLRHVLYILSHVIAPATPFFAEQLFQATREAKDAESVHLAFWPEAGSIDLKLLEEMTRVRGVVSQALKLREEAGIKIRQPLAQFASPTKFSAKWSSRLVAEEVNVKKVVHASVASLDTTVTPELREEGIVRDLVRRIQEWRKSEKLAVSDRPDGELHVSPEEEEVALKHRLAIIAATGLKSLTIRTHA